MPVHEDRVLRAITDDNAFRVIVAVTTETVRAALAAQGAAGSAARHFADLLTGTVLVRETMSPHHRVQGILSGEGGRGRLVADAHPDGSTRGLVQLPPGGSDFRFGRGSMLQMMRTMANGSIYRGLVNAAGIEDVSGALMSYMQDSEQIVTVIATGWCRQNDSIASAGGYVVQLLPEGKRDALRTMTERLEALPDVEQLLDETAGSAPALMARLLRDSPYTQLDDRPVRFHCWCTHEAVVATLATLGREELAAVVRDQEIVELTCDYCSATYRVGRAQLQGLLESS